MHNRKRARTARGFSLLEIVVVISIVGILAGIAIPAFGTLRQKAQLRSAANRLVGDFKEARVLAGSGRQNMPTWPANARVEMAGIRFISPTQYAIFADSDATANGNEVLIRVVDITAYNDTFHFLPGPPEVRFRRSGTLVAPPDIDIFIRNSSSSEQRTVPGDLRRQGLHFLVGLSGPRRIVRSPLRGLRGKPGEGL
ncbi:MAG: prepilin-type N-terminal cleavage/methylation domain-containing protein [Deltaproteobacteria bacterium]|nr:prepilin-type N-terminal cleavage/methylation domain-containing protein [Deltaproteobacteria bacterium]